MTEVMEFCQSTLAMIDLIFTSWRVLSLTILTMAQNYISSNINIISFVPLDLVVGTVE